MASSSSQSGGRLIEPGPVDTSLPKLQETHVSQYVWNGAADRVLRHRRGTGFNVGVLDLPESIKGYLAAAGFLGVAQVNISQLDHNLISALVERWRPETHTFHITFSECTITLQDVAILFGLRIDGPAVVGVTKRNWKQYVGEMLGFIPVDSDLRGSRIKLKWLVLHFGYFSQQQDNDWWRIVYTRACILRLIGCLLLSDHSGGYVSLRYLSLLENFDQAGQYSWGLTVLSFLYRELRKAKNYEAKEICGFLPLIQIWAWEKMSSIAPNLVLDQREYDTPYETQWRSGVTYARQLHPLSYYRLRFDKMKRQDIIWCPYDHLTTATVPMICVDAMHLWRIVLPLICFNIVECHQHGCPPHLNWSQS